MAFNNENDDGKDDDDDNDDGEEDDDGDLPPALAILHHSLPHPGPGPSHPSSPESLLIFLLLLAPTLMSP